MNTAADLANAAWFTSSYSSGQGECVEVARLPGAVAARDSKNPTGPVLVFTQDGWADFVRGVNAEEFRP
ncbi:DUF397 domain-containing protein [Streptomyces sp. NPDC052773]|uniref:DUF397 domain-containing protein n=1 Tax=Streptomyces sp. NPDC052773 TaxID=3365693 RepID=UPI0037CF5EE5